MTNLSTRMLPMLAVVLISGLSAAGAARAEDAMKPADAMKPDAMKTDQAMADCKAKAGMEADQMKKDEAMKACGDMGMKSGAMGSGTMKPDNAMKPAQSN